jgi:cyclopropane-fatty-acyl-phospholipid synthase
MGYSVNKRNQMWTPGSKLQAFSHKHWIGKTDGGHRYSTEEWFQKYASELLAMLPSRGTLLDVGCGACQLTTYLARHFEWVYAIDSSASMLAAARERIAKFGFNNMHVLHASAQNFPLEIQRVDNILSHGVIQYFSQKDFSDHLRECKRILRPSGLICVANVPDLATKSLYYREILGLRSWVALARRRLAALVRSDPFWDGIGNWFSREDINSAANRLGFEVEFRNSQFYEYRFHALLTPKPT